MKTGVLFASLVFVLVLAVPQPVTAADRSETTRLHGTEYVPLLNWSRVQGLQWRWLKRGESFLLTNRTARFQFIVDSREAHCNGLQLWLLFPLVIRSGQVYAAQLDLDMTLHPLVSLPKNDPGKKIRTICLDPGHGGKEPGYRVGSKFEKDYTLQLAFELRDQLQNAGFKVCLTRSTDKLVELADRPAAARRYGADLFVSLHFNASDGGRDVAKGAEVYALTPPRAPSTNARGEGSGEWYRGNKFNAQNLTLACEIQRSLVRQLGVEDRGVRRARFAVLRNATMPAVLIEAGFMSHPTEGKKIFDAAYRREMARAILNGISSYKRMVDR